MSSHPTALPSYSAPYPGSQFHPLELIPFFRRFPCTFGRNFLYTFIFSSLLGIGYYAWNSLEAGRALSWNVFKLHILISNAIGYSIHALFFAGGAAGLEAAARRSRAGKVAYFSILPLTGVLICFSLVSFIVVVGVRGVV